MNPSKNTVNNVLPAKRRIRKPKTDNNEEGYNSEDEHIAEIRSRVSMKPLDEQALKYVDPHELAKKLLTKGLHICQVAKDGNCLFRAVAHQLYGDQDMQDAVRRQCMDYMGKERDHFSQFVTEEFSEYIARKRIDTVYGNHLELQAIAELYNRPILIYTINEEPINLFQEEYQTDNSPIQLSYHYGNHYNSVYDPHKPTFGVGFGLPGLKPSGADRKVVQQALQESEHQIINQQFVNQALQESEQNVINQQMEYQAMQESEQNVINQQILDQVTKNSEQDLFDAQLIDAQIMDTITKASTFDLDAMSFEEQQYLALVEAEFLEQAKKASFSEYYKT